MAESPGRGGRAAQTGETPQEELLVDVLGLTPEERARLVPPRENLGEARKALYRLRTLLRKYLLALRGLDVPRENALEHLDGKDMRGFADWFVETFSDSGWSDAYTAHMRKSLRMLDAVLPPRDRRRLAAFCPTNMRSRTQREHVRHLTPGEAASFWSVGSDSRPMGILARLWFEATLVAGLRPVEWMRSRVFFCPGGLVLSVLNAKRAPGRRQAVDRHLLFLGPANRRNRRVLVDFARALRSEGIKWCLRNRGRITGGTRHGDLMEGLCARAQPGLALNVSMHLWRRTQYWRLSRPLDGDSPPPVASAILGRGRTRHDGWTEGDRTPAVCLYTARHMFSSRMKAVARAHNLPGSFVSALMGHVSTSTTLLYADDGAEDVEGYPVPLTSEQMRVRYGDRVFKGLGGSADSGGRGGKAGAGRSGASRRAGGRAEARNRDGDDDPAGRQDDTPDTDRADHAEGGCRRRGLFGLPDDLVDGLIRGALGEAEPDAAPTGGGARKTAGPLVPLLLPGLHGDNGFHPAEGFPEGADVAAPEELYDLPGWPREGDGANRSPGRPSTAAGWDEGKRHASGPSLSAAPSPKPLPGGAPVPGGSGGGGSAAGAGGTGDGHPGGPAPGAAQGRDAPPLREKAENGTVSGDRESGRQRLPHLPESADARSVSPLRESADARSPFSLPETADTRSVFSLPESADARSAVPLPETDGRRPANATAEKENGRDDGSASSSAPVAPGKQVRREVGDATQAPGGQSVPAPSSVRSEGTMPAASTRTEETSVTPAPTWSRGFTQRKDTGPVVGESGYPATSPVAGSETAMEARQNEPRGSEVPGPAGPFGHGYTARGEAPVPDPRPAATRAPFSDPVQTPIRDPNPDPVQVPFAHPLSHQDRDLIRAYATETIPGSDRPSEPLPDSLPETGIHPGWNSVLHPESDPTYDLASSTATFRDAREGAGEAWPNGSPNTAGETGPYPGQDAGPYTEQTAVPDDGRGLLPAEGADGEPAPAETEEERNELFPGMF